MDDVAVRIITALGGPGEVSRMTKAPPSTVHGWLRVGLSPSRLDHVQLAAERAGKGAEFTAAAGEANGGEASDADIGEASA